MPELRTARENTHVEIGSQRGRNSHQSGVLGMYDLQGLSCGRTELVVADMLLLAPDPSGTPLCGEVPVNGHIRTASAWELRINYPHSPPNQPRFMGQGTVGWALGAVLCWSPGARPAFCLLERRGGSNSAAIYLGILPGPVGPLDYPPRGPS